MKEPNLARRIRVSNPRAEYAASAPSRFVLQVQTPALPLWGRPN